MDNVNRDVILDTVEIRDINDNILSAYPLDLLNKDSQFYVTKPILTPDSTFKIAVSKYIFFIMIETELMQEHKIFQINGHTSTEEKITRIAPTAIEHQKPDLGI